jgi:5'-deoxynucleotidase YfbR-like HD superfamily hydrolase
MKSITAAVRHASKTKRLHTWSIIGQQNIAEHSWGVAMLVRELYRRMGTTPRAELLMAALSHDLPEGHLGDMPAPVKWKSEEIRQRYELLEQEEAERLCVDDYPALSENERVVLEFADKMELLWFCVEQRRLGNVGIRIVFERQLQYVLTRLRFPPEIAPHTSNMLSEAEWFWLHPGYVEGDEE